MDLIKWYESKFRLCNWFDMTMLKVCTFFFALLLAKLWLPLLSLDWYWYALVFVITAIYLASRWVKFMKSK